MKRVVAVVIVMMLVLCETVYVEGVGTQIDGAALNWYAQATTASLTSAGVPLSVAADELDGYWLMLAYYDVEDEKAATIEEAMTAEERPCDLIVVYDNYDNSITFMFERRVVAEIPQSVEVFADGQQLKGQLFSPPEDVNDATTSVGFCFSLEEVGAILNANDVFMRLVTDKGTSYIEVSSENTLVPYYMLATIYFGVRYSLKGDEWYLDKDILREDVRDWQPQVTPATQSTGVALTNSFQTDYEAIDKAAQSAFLLEVYDNKDELIATGSGFIAFDKSAMITNEHVIEGGAYVIAYSDQYRNQYKLTELLAVDAEMDIAILKFDETANVSPLSVDCNAKLLRGQPVTAIGSPQGVLNTVSSGNISNIVYYSEKIPDYIQFTAPISPGSSGGALFNEQGNVIGLCVSYLKEAEAMYYAIPIKYVESLYTSSRNQVTTSLEEYNGLLRFTDPLTGVSFSIPRGWSAPEVTKETKGEIVVGLAGETDGLGILYIRTDMAVKDPAAALMQAGGNRKMLDIRYFTPEYIHRFVGVSKNDLILLTFAGQRYYCFGMEKYDRRLVGWAGIRFHDGYMYQIVYIIDKESADTNSDLEMYEFFADLLNTFIYP